MTLEKLESNILKDIAQMNLLEEEYGNFSENIDRQEVETIIINRIKEYKQLINTPQNQY